jgi:tetratricopeptide (TPR) repeat protein
MWPWFRAMLASAVLGYACVFCTRAPVERAPDDVLAQMARLRPPRTFVARLSIPQEYRPCTRIPAADSAVPRYDCGERADSRPPSGATLDFAARISVQLADSLNIDALHASALVDLLWADTDAAALNRSIANLDLVSRLGPHTANALVDLAAAHLVRAERLQTARDLIMAVDAADRALEVDSLNVAARWNLAVALDALGLEEEAARAWAAMLAIDPTSPWAVDVSRVRRVATTSITRAPPAITDSASAIRAFVRQSPQEARLYGWDVVLGDWGAAIQHGDRTRADSLLGLARAIGDDLALAGGDASLADAVRAITQERDAAGRKSLAFAHHTYAVGRVAFLAADYPRAQTAFEQIERQPLPSPSLTQWATLFHAATLVYAARFPDAIGECHHLAMQVNASHTPALAATTHWALGTALLRTGRSGEAIGEYRRAASWFSHIGERENLGAVEYLAADAALAIKDVPEADVSTYHALAILRAFRKSVWLHNLLFVAADGATRAGLPHAALRLQAEGLSVAAGMGRPLYVVEAQLHYARLLEALGNDSAAVAAIKTVAPLIDHDIPKTARPWFSADMLATEATASMHSAPATAATSLDSAAAYFRRGNDVVRLVPILTTAAQAHIASGDVKRAQADLRETLTIIAEEHDAISRLPLRTSLMADARGIVDELVMAQVSAERPPSESLVYLEEGRASLAPIGAALRRVAASVEFPPGQVVVDYATIGDTLLIWTIAGSHVSLTRRTLAMASLASTVGRVRTELNLRSGSAAVHTELAALFDWIIRPVDSLIGGENQPLVIVADGIVADVPFAALWDAHRAQYLIERHPLRVTSSLRDARRAPMGRRSAARPPGGGSGVRSAGISRLGAPLRRRPRNRCRARDLR